MPDPEKIKEILDMVSDRVPTLLKKLSEVLYGEDQAKTFGKAVAIFYNELKDTGMTQEQIFELTKAYMSTLNIGSMMSGAASHHGHGGGGGCDGDGTPEFFKEMFRKGHKDDK